jgi:hypothetical protein
MPNEGTHESFVTVTMLDPVFSANALATAQTNPAIAAINAVIRAARALPAGNSISTSTPMNEL